MELSLKDLKNTPFGGFEKESVLRYLRQVAQEHDQELQAMKQELEALREAQPGPAPAPAPDPAPGPVSVQTAPPPPVQIPSGVQTPGSAQTQLEQPVGVQPPTLQLVPPPAAAQPVQADPPPPPAAPPQPAIHLVPPQSTPVQAQTVEQVNRIADTLQEQARTLEFLLAENQRLQAEVDGCRAREKALEERETESRLQAERLLTQARDQCERMRMAAEQQARETMLALDGKLSQMSRLSREFTQLCQRGEQLVRGHE